MKRMSMYVMTLVVAFLTSSVFVVSAATITGVTAKQRYPWNGKVDITYMLTGSVTAQLPIVLSVSAADQVNGTNYTAEASAISGDTGVSAGAHHIVWDLNEQGLEFKSSNVVFTVSYIERPTLYCVIDLSAGANATSYPVTYTDSPPSGGFNTDAHKTTKLVLRLIEPGTFMMCGKYEVTLTKPFYCGIFEVTARQYDLVMGTTTSYGDKRPKDSVSYYSIRGSSEGRRWPISSAVDASSFLGKLRARTDLDFDLPTEAQWEYTCRAGSTSKYNNGGNTENDLKIVGRYRGNADDGKGEYPRYIGGVQVDLAEVGSYIPNAWGIYDMHGNVWEWCLNWFYENLSTNVTDPVGPFSGTYRVIRGGGISRAEECDSSHRDGYEPQYNVDTFGFRIVWVLPN